MDEAKEVNGKLSDSKDEIPKPESSSVEVEQQDSEVVIEVERKISKDRLTSIKVIPSDKTDMIAVPLPEEREETDEKALEVKVEASEKIETEEALNTSAVIELEPETKVEKEPEDTEQTEMQEEVQNVSVALEVQPESDGVNGEGQTDNVDGKTEPFLEYEIDDELPWARYRSLDAPPKRNPVEEDDEWPQSEDDEDHGMSTLVFSLMS